MECVTCGTPLAGAASRDDHNRWHRELIAMLAELRRQIEEIRAVVQDLEVGHGR